MVILGVDEGIDAVILEEIGNVGLDVGRCQGGYCHRRSSQWNGCLHLHGGSGRNKIRRGFLGCPFIGFLERLLGYICGILDQVCLPLACQDSKHNNDVSIGC